MLAIVAVASAAGSASLRILPRAFMRGTDITRVLRGETLPARDLGWHFPHYWGGDLITPYSSLRSGDWKIVRWYEYATEELYNLVADPSEKTDLAKRYPQKLAEMHGKLDAWLKSNDAQPPILKKNAPPALVPSRNKATDSKWY